MFRVTSAYVSAAHLDDDNHSAPSAIVSLLKLQNGEIFMGFLSRVNVTKYANYG
jgi:hypothetical protein